MSGRRGVMNFGLRCPVCDGRARVVSSPRGFPFRYAKCCCCHARFKVQERNGPRRPLRKKAKRTRSDDPYVEGYDAFAAGVAIAENPFKRGCDCFELWIKGYHRAECEQ